jgi:hypothetical protein
MKKRRTVPTEAQKIGALRAQKTYVAAALDRKLHGAATEIEASVRSRASERASWKYHRYRAGSVEGVRGAENGSTTTKQ